MLLPTPDIIARQLQKLRPIDNALSGAVCVLVPITSENVPDNLICEQVAAICNEPPIYDILFAERCAGLPYTRSDAERFLNWARRGWQEHTHFVYLIRDSNGVPAGAIDIKSVNLDGAEIGYWLSRANSGVMTNAVNALCDGAWGAGYARLYALVRVTNDRSAKVLRRAGFAIVERFEKNGIPYDRWERALIDAS